MDADDGGSLIFSHHMLCISISSCFHLNIYNIVSQNYAMGTPP